MDLEAAEEIPTLHCAWVSWWAGRQTGLRLNALPARQCFLWDPDLYLCQALLLPLRKTGPFSPGLGKGSTVMLCAWHSPKALQCLQLQTHLPHGSPNRAVQTSSPFPFATSCLFPRAGADSQGGTQASSHRRGAQNPTDHTAHNITVGPRGTGAVPIQHWDSSSAHTIFIH